MKEQMQINQQKIKRASGIVATVVVSMSELQEVNPYFTLKSTKDNLGNYTKWFLDTLKSLGMDTDEFIREDLNSTHRNRLNKIVTCPKWTGEELLTDAWINSGYASQAAKDKANGSLLLEACYRARGETKDMQAMLNQRDKSTEVDQSLWIKE